MIELFLYRAAENTTYGAELSFTEHYAFGETQRNWFLNELDASVARKAKWRIIASNTVWGQSPSEGIILSRELFGEDQFEGYDQERQLILDHIDDNDIDNIIILS